MRMTFPCYTKAEAKQRRREGRQRVKQFNRILKAQQKMGLPQDTIAALRATGALPEPNQLPKRRGLLSRIW